MSAAVDRVLAALEEHGCGPRQNGKGWSARCPLHDDRKPSLSIDAGDDGRALVFCHVCGREATPQLVEAIGLRLRDLHADNGQRRGNGQARRIVATYDYVDESGELLYQVVRLHPKDFRQRRPDGAGGFIWNLRGVPRVLYRLPELVKAPPEAVVFACEGEKDCDRLAGAGLIATCCPGGAGKWSRVDSSPLTGRRIVVVPDNDEGGLSHAQQVAAALHGKATFVKVLGPLVEKKGGDVSDWLDAGGDPEDLDRLAAEAPLWEPGPPPELEPYRNGRESMAAVRKMCKTVEGMKEHAKALAGEVAIWFDRKGDQQLTKADGADIGYPVAYAAAAVGVTRQHLYLLRDIGRVRRLLPVSSADDTSDRALRPLVKLLKDHPEQIPGIVEKAWVIAGDRPITGRHVRQAIGQDHGGEKIPRASAPSEIARRLTACLDSVTATPDAPLDVLRPLRTARDNARTWAKGGDR